MKINVYITNPLADSVAHSSYWMLKFLEGLRQHGSDEIVVGKRGELDLECDLSIIWGVLYDEVMEYHKANNTNFLVVERGYTPNRSEWCMAGFNGLNGLANFCNKNMPSDRWDKYHNGTLYLPNPAGEYVLILGQVKGDTALYGVDIDVWAMDTKAYFDDLGIPCIFRPHPGTSKTLFEDSMPDLQEQIDKAYCVITYSSSGGVEALLRGKPTIALHKGSMIWDIASHALEDHSKGFVPERQQWANDFAYTQWKLEEFASGETWEHLKGYVNGSQINQNRNR